MSDDDEFTRLIRCGTPTELRQFCALVEADPKVTLDLLSFIATVRKYADELQADLERAGIDCGQDPCVNP